MSTRKRAILGDVEHAAALIHDLASDVAELAQLLPDEEVPTVDALAVVALCSQVQQCADRMRRKARGFE